MTRAFLGSGVLIDAVTMSMLVAGTRSANAKHDWAIRAAYGLDEHADIQ